MNTPTIPAPSGALRPFGRLTMERWGLPLGLCFALSAGWLLEMSPVWSGVRAGLASVDFDPARTALISAWLACFAVALAGGLLTARSWPSVLSGVGFLGATFGAPWAIHALSHRPTLFGSPDTLNAGAFLGNLAVIMAVGFLAAIPAAASGRLLRESLSGLGLNQWRALPLGVLVVSLLVTALGVGPLVRYGPGNGLYTSAGRPGAAVPGQVSIRTFHSSAMGDDRPFAVYLPGSYNREPRRTYPSVYLLHGGPGSYHDWLNLGVTGILDGGTGARALPEAIVVMPDGNGRTGRFPQWVDSWDGRDRVESGVLELVSVVDGDYRTQRDARKRVIAGLSDGGFGAANLAARHPELFGTAISLSGYFRAEGAAFGPDPAFLRANSPHSLVQDRLPARNVDFLLIAGQQDQRYLLKAKTFAAELDGLGVRHALFEVPGGHDGGVWTNGLILGLKLVKAQLEEPLP